MRERGVARVYQGDITPHHEGEGCSVSFTWMLLQIMRERGVVRALPVCYYSTWCRGMWWDLCQDDIAPNHGTEVCGESLSRVNITLSHQGVGCRESYTRMILLQIMRESGVVRALPGWYHSKSWRRGVWWELYQEDITPHHGGEACGESYTWMILLQIMRERGVVRPIPGWYYSKSWQRGVYWELCEDDITPNHEEEGCGESCTRMIVCNIK